jgi:DNA-binding CsgD family transcriptional regulator
MVANRSLIVKSICYDRATEYGSDQYKKQNISIIEEKIFFDSFKNIPGIISWKTRDAVYLGCNQTFALLSGLSCPEDIIGKRDQDLPWGNKGCSEVFQQEDNQVLSGQTIHILGNYSFSDKRRIVLTQKIPIIDKEGSIIGVFSYMEEFHRQNIMDILMALSEIAVNITEALVENIKHIVLDIQSILNKREQECCFFLLNGKTAKEIGKILKLHFRTVEGNISSIKMKLGCKKQSEIIVRLLEEDYANNIHSGLIVQQFEKRLFKYRNNDKM